MELTDVQICKRIAEIENKGDCFAWFNTFAIRTEMYSEREEYNPLTDDALCFQLMVKYRVSVFHEYNYVAVVSNDGGEFVGDANLHESPNRAICLAIIEANKPS